MEQLLNKIFEGAKQFYEEERKGTSNLDKWNVEMNENLKNNPPVMEQFKEALKHVKCEGIEDGYFGWNGGSKEGSKKKFENGFDPNKRNTSAFGSGEYFAMKFDISLNYAKKHDPGIILCFILKGNHVNIFKNTEKAIEFARELKDRLDVAHAHYWEWFIEKHQVA